MFYYTTLQRFPEACQSRNPRPAPGQAGPALPRQPSRRTPAGVLGAPPTCVLDAPSAGGLELK